MFHIATNCDSLPAGGTIVRQDQYAASLEADRILTQARADADQIRRDARQEYARQQQQGYEDGAAHAQAEAAERMLETIAEAKRYFTVVEQRSVEVVQKALRRVLGEMDDEDLIFRAVRHALAWARSQSHVSLRVEPGQARSLQERVDELCRDYPAIDVLDVQADDRLNPGQCILETEIGSVDASIDVQLAAIESALQRAIRDPGLEPFRKPLNSQSRESHDSVPTPAPTTPASEPV